MKRNQTTIILLVLFFTVIGLIPFKIRGQSLPGRPQPRLPDYTPVSPEAAAIMKYINYPVDYSNGLPKIEIPIYEIVVGDITIPISLKYHSSGFKVNTAETWLGYGWALNAEPIITRSIKGSADEESYLKENPLRGEISVSYRKSLAEGSWDEEPDLFYYTLLNNSGKFFLKKEKNVAPSVQTVPKEPLGFSFPLSLNTFEITDNKGLKYIFGGAGRQEFTDGTSGATSWKCASITSRRTGQTVTFDYYGLVNHYIGKEHSDKITVLDSCDRSNGLSTFNNSPLNTTEPPPEFQLRLPAVLVDRGGTTYYHTVSAPASNGWSNVVPTGIQRTSSSSVTNTLIKCAHLSSITFPGGRVVFEKKNGLLSAIKVYDANQNLIKQFELVQSQASNTLRVSFDTLKLMNVDGNGYTQYKFEYNSIIPVGFSDRSVDYWGYYNGVDLRYSSLVPSLNVSGRDLNNANGGVRFSIGGANRNANPEAAKTGMLRSITYPSGGKTLFDYEGNYYRDMQNNVKLAGGLRIRQIKETNTDGTTLNRLFKYGENLDGTGYLSQRIDPADFFIENTDVYCHPSYIAINGNNSNNPVQVVNSSSIWKVRRRIYFCNPLLSLISEAGAPVVYEKVTEFQSKDNFTHDVTGRIDYTFNVPRQPLIAKVYADPSVVDRYLGWHYGENISQEFFKKEIDVFSSVKKTLNIYDVYSDEDKVLTRKVYKRNNVISDSSPIWLSYENFGDISYDISTGFKNISSTTDSVYSSEGIYNTKMTYVFDRDKNLIRQTMVENDGGKINEIRSYPKHYSDNTGFIGEMKTNNLLSYPIEYIKYRENGTNINIISGQIITYKNGGRALIDKMLKLNNSGIVPLSAFKFSNRSLGIIPPTDTLSSYQPDTKYELESQILSYDGNGNPRELKRQQEATTVYLWGYNSQYPVLEIKNATYAEVSTLLTQTAIDNLNSSIQTEATMATLIKNAADKLRTDLPKAMVTSYTYKPLVGMTSKTDARGIKETYMYDGMQRLQAVLDHLNYVNKTFDYHYRPN